MAKQKRKPTVAEHLIGLVLFGLMCWGLYSCSTSQNDRPARPDDIGAWVYAQEYVKLHLKSPSTADFDTWNQTASRCVTDEGDGLYTVRGYVDSQNAFGATIRTRFVLKLQFLESSGKWDPLGPPQFLP